MRALALVLLSGILLAGPAGAQAPASAPFEFNGLIVAGERTLVCVTSLPERHSRWIAVGSQSDGIKVTRYDAQTQQVVVEASGRSHTIALRQPEVGRAPGGGTGWAAPSTAPLPMAATTARVPVTNEEKEAEARFLVSDLLEIGMIQRKAYEEAQKKAKDGKAPPPPAPKADRP